MGYQDIFNIKSLGRVASLGDLYDARSEKFLGYSLLKTNLPESCSIITDMPHTDFKYDYKNTFDSKFSKLDVSAELKVSVLCGMVSLEGSGKYLNDKKENHKSVKADLIYAIRTKDQRLILSDSKSTDIISHDSLGLTDATHVVTGITWGANAIASFEYSNDENSDKKEISGNLKAIVEKVSYSISGKAGANFTEGQNKLKTQLSIRFFGDVLIKGKVPQTVEEVLTLMGNMLNTINKTNDGKGSPLEYTLSPLRRFEKFIKRDKDVNQLINEIDQATLMLVETTFDELLEATQKFNDFKGQVSENEDFIEEKQLREINSKANEIRVSESMFKDSLKTKLIEVRSGKGISSNITKFINDFKGSPSSPYSLKDFIIKHSKLSTLLEQISLNKK